MKLTTLKFRIKDATTKKHLVRHAGAVNFVWNYCNESSIKQVGYNGKFLSNYDLHNLTAGCSKDLSLPSQTIQVVCNEYVTRRRQYKKSRLRWRSRKRSLGWIPFKAVSIKLLDFGKFYFNGKVFRFWQTVDHIGKVRFGSFSQDARGRWYINMVVEDTIQELDPTGNKVGVDLGLKTIASYSDGSKLEATRFTYKHAGLLAMAQRAKKKRRIKSIYAKIANSRRDALHKETTRVANSYDIIFVGDVSSTKLAKTKMAKSVLDAGWGMYRSMLSYKAIRLGRRMVNVKENHSTVTCSDCHERTFKGGLSTLGIREWKCSNCGSVHDRDVNAAKNILRLGHQTLKEESLYIKNQRGCQPLSI